MSTTPDPIPLLRELIAAKSYSGDEARAADVVEQALRAGGATTERHGNNVVATKGRGERALLLNSHLDTVPASDKWTRDPWEPAINEDRLYGLGSTDAKSCVAALACAFLAAADPGAAGRLIYAATVEEETGGGDHPNGMESVLPDLLPVAAGIVGEPTALNICNGQRGLVRLILHVDGRAGHASRPWEGENAIEAAAEAILRIRELAAHVAQERRDPVLGVATIQPTLLTAGTAKNVIPDHAEVTLDIRTTTTCGNDEIIELVRAAAATRDEVISRRFQPVATAIDDPLIQMAQRLLPEAEVRAFGGVSDLFFLTSIPDPPAACFLLGPGDGRQSHQPDEFVSISMVRRGAAAYRALADAFREG